MTAPGPYVIRRAPVVDNGGDGVVVRRTCPRGLNALLVGLVSPSEPDEAYVHFVGVHPGARNGGLARALYDLFFQLAREHDRHLVKAVTSPVNQASIAFHQRLGFTVRGPVPDYNGPGRDLVTFERRI